MSETLFVWIIVGFTLFGSLLFGSLPYLVKLTSVESVLRSLTGIAAGFLIGAALLIVIPEGYELYIESHSSHSYALGHDTQMYGLSTLLFRGGVAILAGFVFMLVLEGFGFGHDIHEEHHDHGERHGHGHVHHQGGNPTAVIVGLSLHALTDGLVIGAALSQQSFVISAQLLVVIMMHKLPAAFSVTAFSLHERSDPTRVKWDLLLFRLATPLAILLSWQFLKGLDPHWPALAMLLSAGTFLYVATVDVWPQIHNASQAKRILMTVGTGIVAIALIKLLLGLVAGNLHLH